MPIETILIVDDNVDLARTLARSFERRGFVVRRRGGSTPDG